MSSIKRLLREVGLIMAIIGGGLLIGALTPAYSQDDLGQTAVSATAGR